MSRGLGEPEDPGSAKQLDPERVAFGPYLFDRRTGELWKGETLVPIQPQPARVLGVLLAQAGTLVSREQLCEELWGNRFVEADVGLNYCVRQIRRALGDDVNRPCYIETLRGRGYRFVRSSVHSHRRPAERRRWVIAALGAGLLTGAAVHTGGTGPAHLGPAEAVVLSVASLSNITGAPACGFLAHTVPADLRSQLSAEDPAHLEVVPEEALLAAGARGKRFLLTGVVREDATLRWVTFYLIRAQDGKVTWTESLRTAALISAAQRGAFIRRMIHALRTDS